MATNAFKDGHQLQHQSKVYQSKDINKKEREIVKPMYHHLATRGDELNMSEIKRLMQLKEKKDILEKGDGTKCFLNKYSDISMVSKELNKGTNVVQTVVNIEFCKTFDSKQGCGQKACPKLHVCRHFIKGKCTFGSKCKKPHHFEGAHTQKILKEHLLESLTHAQLKEFLCRNVQFALEDTVNQANLPKQLEICKYYNVAIGCSREGQCPFLHVCRFYAEEGTCKFGQKCIRKHDVYNEHARKVLARYDVHESQIWPHLRKKTTQNFGCIMEDEFSPTDFKTSNQRAFSNITNLKQGGQKQRTKSSSYPENSEKCRPLMSEPVRKFSDPIQREFRDVKQEICESALNGMCIDSMYCTKIHHNFPFSWQQSQNGKFWHNFSSQENLKIEAKFVDVYQQEAIVSFDDHHELVLDFCRGIAIQNIHPCILKNGIYNALPNAVQLRRLSTPSSVNSVGKDSNFFTRWIWYYLDDRNNWQSYDDDDDGCSQSLSRKAHLVNCAAIEIAYLDPRRNSFQFKRGAKNFIIDFTSMLQQEVETKLFRDVRRRPAKSTAMQVQQEPVRVDNTAAEKSFFPSYWQIAEIGIPGDFGQCKMLQLGRQSREYLSVLSDFQRSMKNCHVEKIMAVQNPRLWMTYAMKREKLAEINASNAEEKMLYRVASLEMAAQICQNGFEAGSDSHQVPLAPQVKEAPYFAREARLANRSNRPNANGFCVMFLCKVLISACATTRLGMKEALTEGYHPSDDLSMYYVFDQDQVYPEFSVLFKF